MKKLITLGVMILMTGCASQPSLSDSKMKQDTLSGNNVNPFAVNFDSLFRIGNNITYTDSTVNIGNTTTVPNSTTTNTSANTSTGAQAWQNASY